MQTSLLSTKSHYHNVLERMYSEFQASILYSPSIIQPENQLTFVLFGENVFMVDNVLARVNSFAGVNSADAYILTKWQYYDDWIMKEINNRLLLRPVLQRSRKILESNKRKFSTKQKKNIGHWMS
jgi:hypothetical protein